jgi:hypothetical protein
MDHTSNLQDYQILVNAYKGFYRVEPEKNWNLNYIPLRTRYNHLKRKNVKYYFLGSIISKLELINLIIFYWPYRPQIASIDFKIMPWLKILSQDKYRFVWSKECYEMEIILLRNYFQINLLTVKTKVAKSS